MTLRVRVDADQCQGNGVCSIVAPAVFELDDDAVVHLLAEDVPADEEPHVREAVDSCPRQALALEHL